MPTLRVRQVAFKPESLMQRGNLLERSYLPNTSLMMIFAVSSSILIVKFLINVCVGATETPFTPVRTCACVHVREMAGVNGMIVNTFISVSLIARDAMRCDATPYEDVNAYVERRRPRVGIINVSREIPPSFSQRILIARVASIASEHCKTRCEIMMLNFIVSPFYIALRGMILG